jgi:uncharacterized membrane protein
MAIQPTTDAPFGLQPNVAAGLAWVFGLIGGLVMLFGGGTNKFVKFAAAQSAVLWGGYLALIIVLNIVIAIVHFLALILLPLFMILGLVMMVVWIYTTVMGFQGKDLRLPVIAPFAAQIFASQLA